MNPNHIRLKRITMEHFKNVTYGEIEFPNHDDLDKSSVLGIYGQNGSGKTAAVEALRLLRQILRGAHLPKECLDYIQSPAKTAKIKVEMQLFTPNNHCFNAIYAFELGKFELKEDDDEPLFEDAEQVYFPCISAESITYQIPSYTPPNNVETVCFSCSDGKTFDKTADISGFSGGNDEVETKLHYIKRLSFYESRSFFFSKNFINEIRDYALQHHKEILWELKIYGQNGLFVVDSMRSATISQHILPLAVPYHRNSGTTVRVLNLSLGRPQEIPAEFVAIAKVAISCINVVLSQVVPDCAVTYTEKEGGVAKSGEQQMVIELFSKRGALEIPLKYESEGIKKLISIINYLIVMYNNPGCTVVVDELDAGIFEYLLGELVHILEESGRGQLLFTSHNLRVLETLEPNSFLFTTTNPINRYIKVKTEPDDTNLRDYYYRDLMLGLQDEVTYERTSNAEIAFALREAGEFFEG